MKNRTLLLFLLLLSSGVNASSSLFFEGTWEQARKLAKKENKYIFLDCWTEWCGYCKMMDNETFVDSTVVDFMQTNFISLSRDMERGEGRLLSMKYHTEAYPTFLIFNPSGKLCYNLSGYMNSEAFIDSLSHALKPINQHLCNGFSDNLEPGYPEFYKIAFGLRPETKFVDSTEVISWLNKQEDWSSEICWAVIWKFAGGVKHQQWTLENGSRLYELYGNEVWMRISGLLGYYGYVASTEKSDSLFKNVLRQCTLYLPEPYRSYRIGSVHEHYYERTENWKLFAEHMDVQFRNDKFQHPEYINEISWKIYEKSVDTSAISKAICWMQIVVKTDTSWEMLDTYAHLLFKAGHLKEAEIQAQLAVEAATRQHALSTETRDLLDKIQAGKKE